MYKLRILQYIEDESNCPGLITPYNICEGPSYPDLTY